MEFLSFTLAVSTLKLILNVIYVNSYTCLDICNNRIHWRVIRLFSSPSWQQLGNHRNSPCALNNVSTSLIHEPPLKSRDEFNQFFSSWLYRSFTRTDLTYVRIFGFIAPKALNYLVFQSFESSIPDESYSRNASCALNLISICLYYYHSVGTSADGVYVPEGIIRPVVSGFMVY